MMPQSLGVIGGKPNSAHYFIGYVGESGVGRAGGCSQGGGGRSRAAPHQHVALGAAALAPADLLPPTQVRSSSIWTPTPRSRPCRLLTAA